MDEMAAADVEAASGSVGESVEAHAEQPARGPLAWVIALGLASLGTWLRLAHFLRVNRAEIADASSVYVVAAVAAVVTAVVTLVIARGPGRSPIRVGAAVGFVGWSFFSADVFGEGSLTRPLVWSVAVGTCAYFLSGLVRRPLVGGIVLVVSLAVSSLWWLEFSNDHLVYADEGNPSRSPAVPATGGERPNIYFFVADGMVRPDVAKAVLGHDQRGFVDALDRLGFTTDPSATVNYPETTLSLSSMLEQQYLVTTADDGTAFRGAENLERIRGRNRTVRQLADLGFETVRFAPGLVTTLDCTAGASDPVDRCYDPSSRAGLLSLDEVQRALVEASPLGPMFRDQRIAGDAATTFGSVLDDIAVRSAHWSEPYFVQAHVIMPHPPYRVDERCEPLSATAGSLGEGWGAEHRPYYLDAVECVERTLTAELEELVRRDPTAIVLVQGDHGPAFDYPYGASLSDLAPAQLAERFGTLSAWRLPDRCRPDDPDASSAVNTFRIVVACIRGTKPKLLDAKAFRTSYGSTSVEELPDPILGPVTDH